METTELFVEIEGSSVYHMIKNSPKTHPEYPMKVGRTICDLPFEGREIVNQSSRRLCKSCQRKGERAKGK